MFLFRQSVVSHPYTCYHWRHVRLSVYGITTINHMLLPLFGLQSSWCSAILVTNKLVLCIVHHGTQMVQWWLERCSVD